MINSSRLPLALRRPLLLVLLLFTWPVLAYECQPLEPVQQDRSAIEHERGLLWQINKAGVQPSYLFGTIHVSDPAISDLPEAVTTALKRSEQFVMEAQLDAAAMLAFAQEMFFRDGTQLSELIDADLYARAETLLAKYGIPPMAVQSLKPWAAFMKLSMPPDNGLPLDLVLKSRAQEQGLSVHGLETVTEQAAIFEELDRVTQIRLLRDSVCHYETLQGDMADMKQLYLQRDLAGLFSYHNKYRLHATDEYRRLMKRLLWDRNQLMAERMQSRLEAGGVFVAVGAMHLAGEQGILNLLEAAGYQVKPIY